MIPMSMRVKGAIDAWVWGGGVSVLRRVAGAANFRLIGITGQYAAAARSSGIVSHDLGSCAKLCRAAGGALEQIELLLGACAFETTE
jgi:hypothetical protein